MPNLVETGIVVLMKNRCLKSQNQLRHVESVMISYLPTLKAVAY